MMRKLFISLFAGFCFANASAQFESAPAFPGAEGFGRYVSGGRGGAVYHVTSLADDGSTGTLRWACSQSGKRTIVFDVSGTIYLTKELSLSKGDVSILGQTAPGDGICIADYPFVIKSSNVIMRYLRFRLGNRQVAYHEGDGLGGMDQSNIIVDHCSVSWSIDECLSVYGSKNISVQWNIVDQSLVNSGHSKGAHGYGGNWGGSGASYHHNLLAHHTSRTPRLGPRQTTQTDERMDMRNNVIYNWGGNGCYGGEGMNVNIINNYYKPGPGTMARKTAIQQRIASVNIRTSEYTHHDTDAPNGWDVMWHVWGKYYVNGNVNSKYPAVTNDNWTYGVYNQIDASGNDGTYTAVTKDTIRIDAPIEYGYITTHSAEDAFTKVCNYAGASYRRDSHDLVIADDAKNGTAKWGGTDGYGFIDNQDQAGGWPVLMNEACPLDTDRDGMPDAWEKEHGLNPDDASDGAKYNLDSRRYYTNLEVYCNSLVEEQIKAQNEGGMTDVKGAFQEYYPDMQNGEFEAGNVENLSYESVKKWDFTSRSAATTENMTADAGWSVSGSNYTYLFSLSSAELKANGMAVQEAEGLQFSVKSSKLVSYPTSLRMNAAGDAITIQGMKKNDKIVVTWKTASNGSERGFTTENLSVSELLTPSQDTKEAFVVTDGDVTLRVTGGIYLLSIEYLTPVAASVEIIKAGIIPSVSNQLYDIAGRKVERTAPGIKITAKGTKFI